MRHCRVIKLEVIDSLTYSVRVRCGVRRFKDYSRAQIDCRSVARVVADLDSPGDCACGASGDCIHRDRVKTVVVCHT